MAHKPPLERIPAQRSASEHIAACAKYAVIGPRAVLEGQNNVRGPLGRAAGVFFSPFARKFGGQSLINPEQRPLDLWQTYPFPFNKFRRLTLLIETLCGRSGPRLVPEKCPVLAGSRPLPCHGSLEMRSY